MTVLLGPVPTCSIGACGKPVESRGWCSKHYTRWLRHGDPEAPSQQDPRPAAAFWSRVDDSGGADACWPWTGRLRADGYGIAIKVEDRTDRPHRHALRLSLGRPIGRGLHAMHSCDNPPCCNPKHLREGTTQQNTQEAVARGRMQRGEERSQHVLSVEEVRDIRRSPLSSREAAVAFGVHDGTVRKIRRGERWRHVR